MNKKLLSVLLAATMLCGGLGAFAEGENGLPYEGHGPAVTKNPALETGPGPVVTKNPALETGPGPVIPNLTGVEADEKIIFDYSGNLIFMGYSNDGELLYASKYCRSVDGKIEFDKENLYTVMKAYDVEKGLSFNIDIELADTTPSPEPTETANPTATPNPTSKPTSTYNPNEFPEVYEKAINAIQAFAVVESVTQEVSDNEQGYRINYWYQGSEQSDWFGEDIEIVAAPQNAQSLLAAPLSSLKRGDVLYLNRSLSGKITEIALIYQNQKKDIVNNNTDFGDSFKDLFSINGGVGGYAKWTVAKYGEKPLNSGTQYAFGVIANRDGNNVYLLDKTGNADKAISLELADKAMIYKCNMNLNSGIELVNTASISSTLSRRVWEEAESSENSIIELKDTGYNYMLARIVDGIVMDAVIYTNYK